MELKKKHILGLIAYILALLLCLTGLRSCDSTMKLPSFDSNIASNVNANAKKVDDLINGIKTPITLESAGPIAAARAAYDALSDADKPFVTLLDKLKGYEETLKGLGGGGLLANTAADLENLLNGFKLPLSAADASLLPDLRKAFEGLSDDEKAKFKGLNLLEGLELSLGGAKGLDDLLKGIKLPLAGADIDLLPKLKFAFDALSDDEKAKFKGFNLLEGLNLSLGGAKGLDDLLNGIKTPITADSANDIFKIRAAYNALSPEEKAKFNGLNLLEGFEADLAKLGLGNPFKVMGMINDIETPITLKCKDAINNALAAYNALSDDDKAAVTNYNLLEDYLKQLNALNNSGSGSDSLPNTGVE